MKKLSLLTLLAFSSLFTYASAPDEGMWLPMLINKNYDQMKAQGFRLTAKDVYDINNASLKDAIVSLDFCTGEIISRDGLMLTNHHCGYSSIQSHSTVEHDYLTDGFWAKNRNEELSSPEMNASVLIRMEDVTQRVLAEIGALPEAEKAGKLKEISKQITEEATKDTWYTASVKDVFGGNQYLLFVYERFTDVRLVGAPPSSIGKFGGDTDNWMWPRHTGDFSLFRIYMSPDGKPAGYSKNNVPYTPKKFLPISLKGIKEGDFAMIMGYPGRTNRYAFSNELQNAVDKTNPALIALLGKRLEVMKADMDKDSKVRIKLADTYASLANSWKYFLGQNDGLKKLGVIEFKRSEEAKFVSWVNSNPEMKAKYGSIFTNIEKLFADHKPNVIKNTYLNLGGFASGISMYPNQFAALITLLKTTDAPQADIATEADKLKAGLDDHFKDYSAETDKKILAEMLALYYKNTQQGERPAYLDEIVKKYKAATPEKSFSLFAADVFKRSIFASKEKLTAFLEEPVLRFIENDIMMVYNSKMNAFRQTYQPAVTVFTAGLAKEKRSYIAGLMEMNPQTNFYPDANSTMRITYGTVKDYAPRDAIEFHYVSTSKGILEKADPTNEEFIVPDKLMDLIRKKDFGHYGENGELVVAFLTDNDITGGNSGSPVINGDGELIGCAFDGNWEAMTGDLVYDKAYKRTISVDIRYVLFVIDKYAGAGYLLNEMDIRK